MDLLVPGSKNSMYRCRYLINDNGLIVLFFLIAGRKFSERGFFYCGFRIADCGLNIIPGRRFANRPSAIRYEP